MNSVKYLFKKGGFWSEQLSFPCFYWSWWTRTEWYWSCWNTLLSEMVNKLLSYSMVSVTVKTTNFPKGLSEKRKRKCRSVSLWCSLNKVSKIPIYDQKIQTFLLKYCLLAGKGLNGTQSNINGLYFPGTAVPTGNF